MNMRKGNLINAAKAGEFDVIIHGCNCFCNFGAGLALSIKEEFPKAFAADKKTIKGNREKLGTISVGKYPKLHIVNAYTQYGYGSSYVDLDYFALRKCLRIVKEGYKGQVIGMPKIGCGLAKGNWDLVKQIIEIELNKEDVTIMYL